MTLPLTKTSSILPGGSRDQTRVARARLAELALKLHARPKGGRASDPSASRHTAQDDGRD